MVEGFISHETVCGLKKKDKNLFKDCTRDQHYIIYLFQVFKVILSLGEYLQI